MICFIWVDWQTCEIPVNSSVGDLLAELNSTHSGAGFYFVVPHLPAKEMSANHSLMWFLLLLTIAAKFLCFPLSKINPALPLLSREG